jgi:hypothetical protein
MIDTRAAATTAAVETVTVMARAPTVDTDGN